MRSYANLRWAVLLASLFTSPATAADSLDYLATVKAYADAMIEHGRDRYGSEPSPLFAGALDRKIRDHPEGEVPGLPSIGCHDRAVSHANPMHHENLYQGENDVHRDRPEGFVHRRVRALCTVGQRRNRDAR